MHEQKETENAGAPLSVSPASVGTPQHHAKFDEAKGGSSRAHYLRCWGKPASHDSRVWHMCSSSSLRGGGAGGAADDVTVAVM